ncbi:SDR family NAD(P)-dependent oxidoreductase [Bordetella bronchiseptica]|uniref:SDR family NAD(P)-dependent oxidoreductase n=1 Tax=Bordetella bronchiseptica TaxID=518 RepID=UPI000290254C|nr:SDR family oxidoreductase [Bordetella bronchiseptica]KCV30160.1 KR domain protein [Bordetella bronchiseptica 00-P-2730]AZW29732.1 oxidoreductase [Bordetella bronchiseptica]KAK52325.1 KR domain protein [Bordetella bronchiseptica OSU054]KAK75391.1 KR domain protein [Bordetella bronchiseptica MO211]KCV39384.1 KR domain protein [Bordetella bronchiseptica 345]
MNYFSLEGRNVLVTGAGQGVGRAIALAMAGHGAGAVVVNDFHAERAEAVAAELRALGCRALGVQADVTDRASVKRMFDAIRQAFGSLHVLVNNAGNAGPGAVSADLPKFWESDEADWQKWIGTNFNGVLNCCREAIPFLMEHQAGRLITIVSDAGRVGESGYAVYSGAKAGAAGFMRAMAKELGRFMATANCIALASVETPGLAQRNADPDLVRKKLAKYVIRRQGRPEDAAGAAVFLASEAGSWITGQTLPVNGGYSFNQ